MSPPAGPGKIGFPSAWVGKGAKTRSKVITFHHGKEKRRTVINVTSLPPGSRNGMVYDSFNSSALLEVLHF